MSEYIKKEEALKALHDFWDECINYDGSGTEMMLDNESVINSLPTYSFPDSNVGMRMSHRAIAKVIDDYIDNHKGDSDKQYTAHEIKTLLISDDSAENKGEWIPVSERLPEESGRYLTYIVNEYDEKLQYIMTADYISRPTPIEGLSPWNVDDECASDNVVAWQPLPEPYQKDKVGL